jgi:uncharacterized protein YgiM (DUF1202 family)
MAKKSSTTKPVRQSKRTKRYYGMQVVKAGEKLCWLASENKHGFALGLALGKRTIWLRNIRFTSPKEVERALKSGVVFVHTRNSKFAKKSK